MRLTLRNLLRFLDQSELRSMERARLEQLVDESETADAWINRIDSLRHNIATPVPALDDSDCDIHQVASYLDGEMSEEATSEFEKSLLGSDQRLAEVASCHEIRESILSEGKASVPLLLRQSIYDLGREVNYDLAVRAREAKQADLDSANDDEENFDSDNENEVAQMAASMHDLPYVDASPDEPEPLLGFSKEPDEADDDDDVVSLGELQNKAARRSSVRVLALFAGALALIGATFALGWYAGSLPKNLDGNDQLAQNIDDDEAAATAGIENGGKKAGDSIEPDSDSEIKTDEVDSDSSDKKIANSENKGSEKKSDDNKVVAGDTHPVLEPPSLEVPLDPNALPQRPQLIVLNLGIEEEATEPVAAPVLLAVADVASSGKRALVSPKDTTVWKSLPVGLRLSEQTRMFVLTGDQIDLDFGGNVKVTIKGPAEFELSKRDVASQSDVLNINFGEFVVGSMQADVDFWLQRGERQYRVTFPEQGSSLEASFTRYREPGSNPLDTPVAELDRLQVASGRANIDDRQQTHSLTAGQGIAQCVAADESLSRPMLVGKLSPPPPPPRSVERLTEIIEDNPQILVIDDEKLMVDHLIEMKSDRRQEYRYAAIAWLASLGNYDHLVDYLNESSNRGHWGRITEAVRLSIQDNPDNAKRLFDALSAAGTDRDLMYQSVLGMSPQALEAGGDNDLVEWLTNDELAVRVLAIEAIKTITEGRSYGYVPYAESKNRKRVVQRQWSKVLRKKELRYPTPPEMPFPQLQESEQNPESPESPEESTVPVNPGDTDQDSGNP